MNKYELKMHLQVGKPLVALFDFIEGQDCMIHKGTFQKSADIIYIPDLSLNEIETDRALTDKEIDHVIEECYSGFDFIDICNGYENVAEALFNYVDWQHPNTQDLLEGYEEEEFLQEFGVLMNKVS